MEIIRVKDAAEGGKKAFELIQQGVENGAKVLGLATGSTPETLYAEMTASDVDFSNMTSVIQMNMSDLAAKMIKVIATL